MKVCFGLAAVLAASVGLASGSAFANTIYNMDLSGGGASAVGTIKTDSTIGVLQEANILDWDLVLTRNSETSSLQGGEQLDIIGPAVTATATGLFFDFDATDPSLLYIETHSHGLPDALCISNVARTCTGDSSAQPIMVGIDFETTTFSIGSGVQQIAAVAPTPLPAALPLFASAIGGLGFVGWWRKRAD
jgi:hypothetical protein